MANGGGESKTEKATPKKRRDERKEGNIFQSNDIVNVVFIFAVFTMIGLFFPTMHETMSEFTKKYIFMIRETVVINELTLKEFTNEFFVAIAKSFLPLAFFSALIAIIAHGSQTKFLFVSKSFVPKFNRLNPIEGVKKLFSLKNIIELIKNLLKVIILIALAYYLLVAFSQDVIRMLDMSLASSVSYAWDMCMQLIFRVSMVFVFIAFFDYMFQKWDYERKIKMSKQEIKEEFKQTEGNPQIKGKVKELQRQMARKRMMQAVPSADVIIRNPDHYAIALKYDKSVNTAPVVVAKGMNEVALRIVAVGEENKITIIENKPLARGLYAQAELDREIPAEFYGAVAEILVYVYKLNNNIK